MKKSKIALAIFMALSMLFTAAAFSGCNGDDGPPDKTEIGFTYPASQYTRTEGPGEYTRGAHESVQDFGEVIINPVTGARGDFIKGVDASTVHKIESLGGKYYNDQGKEQDFFQILAENGVNFFRVRVWNKPRTVTMQEYGGGAVDAARAIEMAVRAQAAGMNVFVNLHYSDIWADPEYQLTPRDWSSKSKEELPAEVESYTYDTLTRFKNAGINVAMVQLGNEINYGMFYDKGGKIDWSSPAAENASFDYISSVLKRAQAGAKRAFPDIYTVIHLANGGTYSEFDTYMSHLARNGVEYDIIGASYYSYYDGGTDALKNTLSQISQKYDKHVLVAETAYAHSDVQTHPFSQNTYTAALMEDRGGFVTSVQGQASMLRDVLQAVASVPDGMGLGAFYWEPGWLPVQGAAVDVSGLRGNTQYQLSSWANQGLFSYGGHVLPSIKAFLAVGSTAQAVNETFTGIKYPQFSVTLNKAENETMPATYAVTGSQGRFIQRAATWNAQDTAKLSQLGSGYTVRGTVEGFNITANVDVIENFIRDSSYENQGEALAAPWQVSWTPAGSNVVKVERKNNPKSGRANLNWWNNTGFELTVWQEITGLADGTYKLSMFIQGEDAAKGPHEQLYMFVREYGGEEKRAGIVLTGWMKWENPSIEFTVTGGRAVIGVYAKSAAETWAHVDDWVLVRTA